MEFWSQYWIFFPDQNVLDLKLEILMQTYIWYININSSLSTTLCTEKLWHVVYKEHIKALYDDFGNKEDENILILIIILLYWKLPTGLKRIRRPFVNTPKNGHKETTSNPRIFEDTSKNPYF